MQKLAGKVAIVTGASRGIGAAAAFALGEAGASVMLAARDAARTEANAQQINAAGGKAVSIACDVADYAACQRLVQETAQRPGHPMRWSTMPASSSRLARSPRRSHPVGAQHPDQPGRRIQRHPRSTMPHAGARARQHHQPLLRCSASPAGGVERLLHRQGRAGDADPVHRPGASCRPAFECSASSPAPRTPTCR